MINYKRQRTTYPVYKGLGTWKAVVDVHTAEFVTWKAGTHPCPDAFWHMLWDLLHEVVAYCYRDSDHVAHDSVHLHLMGRLAEREFNTERLSTHVHYFIQPRQLRQLKCLSLWKDSTCECIPLSEAITPPLENTYFSSLTLTEKIEQFLPRGAHKRYWAIVKEKGLDSRAFDRGAVNFLGSLCTVARGDSILASQILRALSCLREEYDTFYPMGTTRGEHE